MATSNSTNYSVTRADIIKRALRIIGAIGQGESPSTDATTEAAQALNEIVKEWNADGMQLWKYTTSTAITWTAATATISIGIGATIAQQAPLRITQAFTRNTASGNDTPLLLLSKQEYDILGNKSAAGAPSQLYYAPPGAVATEQIGSITLYPVPDATWVAANSLYVVGAKSIMDFDATADTADFPSFYYNSLAWALADQLSYEYGVPYSQQSMITKKAADHKEKALGYDQELGSLFLQPDPNWGNW